MAGLCPSLVESESESEVEVTYAWTATLRTMQRNRRRNGLAPSYADELRRARP